jgi:hypothetical protein
MAKRKKSILSGWVIRYAVQPRNTPDRLMAVG